MSRAAWVLSATLIAFALSPGTAAGDSCGRRSEFLKGRQLTIFGITDDQRLVEFGECNPRRPRREVDVLSGLIPPDRRLVGIDFRVQDGALYGVGTAGGVYLIDTVTAVATKVSQLTVALEGTAFGVDFDPAADRLRIVSNTGQNLRHDVNAGGATIEDADLNDLAGSPPAPVPALGIIGAAHTNNDLDPATGTTLFDLDAATDQLAIQAPPSGGTLTPTGKLTVDTGRITAFDVYSVLKSGAAVRNVGFAALLVDSLRGFYRVDLLTGRAILIGPLENSLVDIAIPLDQ
jgi:hypothetical protein